MKILALENFSLYYYKYRFLCSVLFSVRDGQVYTTGAIFRPHPNSNSMNTNTHPNTKSNPNSMPNLTLIMLTVTLTQTIILTIHRG